MKDPETPAKITKIPRGIHIDFFAAIVVSSFLIFLKIKTQRDAKLR